ncbi:cytochrome P450 4c3 [Caerostris darwini]|uniref:Cytochrome P450 4c3 n=1 Tax=Caerostris darwini TaxID=1538125 RepID=A0AAV4QV10_9ARAC|nr:cytochrome P450 4c3 [Caerostris darwini]
MFFEVVFCALIGIIAVLPILTLWKKKYSRFVPDNKHSVFRVLVDVMDSILFVTSGKKNALHLSVERKKNNRKSDSSQRKERRKLLAVGFQSSMLKGYLTVFNEHAQKWVEFLQEETGKEFTCVESPISLCSLDIVCDHKREETQVYERRNGRRPQRTQMSVGCPLGHIEDQVLDQEGVRQEVDTFIGAGHDTVAVAVKWALFLIGLYPEVQEKIHQELDSVLGADSKSPLSVADLNELKYLECVLKECNRIYPPVPIIARKISEDISICGYTIPKRATIVVSSFFVHRDEDVFPDPEKFDPERFLPENRAHIPDCAYIPFAVGPRDCIGNRLELNLFTEADISKINHPF